MTYNLANLQKKEEGEEGKARQRRWWKGGGTEWGGIKAEERTHCTHGLIRAHTHAHTRTCTQHTLSSHIVDENLRHLRSG